MIIQRRPGSVIVAKVRKASRSGADSVEPGPEDMGIVLVLTASQINAKSMGFPWALQF
jgi:hypothetical protein